VQSELSIVTLVLQASPVVQAIMALLLGVSLTSWTTIFRKGFQIRATRQETDRFEGDFWKDRDLGTRYQQIREGKRDAGSLARIFESGMSEFLKTRQQKPGDVQAMLDGARRSMRASYQREMDGLEANLAFLASAGSVSPYVGLFGTVWGIMHSFTAIAQAKDTSLAVVAPGIAEALFATALGLAAAIPAVIAYNHFVRQIRVLSTEMDAFANDFLNIVRRHILK